MAHLIHVPRHCSCIISGHEGMDSIHSPFCIFGPVMAKCGINIYALPSCLDDVSCMCHVS